MAAPLSYQDKLQSFHISIQRKLFDQKIKLLGKKISGVRIIITKDRYEDESYEVVSSGTLDAIVNYPIEIPLSRMRYSATGATAEDTTVSLFDILPVEVWTPWKEKIEQGDLLVHTMLDENDNPIEMVLQISNVVGSLSSHLLMKKMYAAPYSGSLPGEIFSKVVEMLNGRFSQVAGASVATSSSSGVLHV